MSTMRKPVPLQLSKRQKSVFEPGDIKTIQQELEKDLEQLAEREDSYRNGLYANRNEIMRASSDAPFASGSNHSSNSGNRGSSSKKMSQLRKLFKKKDSDPYAATYNLNNRGPSNLKTKTANGALKVIGPMLRRKGGALDPRLDDTGVNR